MYNGLLGMRQRRVDITIDPVDNGTLIDHQLVELFVDE